MWIMQNLSELNLTLPASLCVTFVPLPLKYGAIPVISMLHLWKQAQSLMILLSAPILIGLNRIPPLPKTVTGMNEMAAVGLALPSLSPPGPIRVILESGCTG